MHNYNVVMIGPSGSGKTVFLASMYKFLSIQRKDTPFFLEVSPQQRKLLNNKYTQIATSEEWPPPTQFREISEWCFRVCVENDSLHKFPAFTFNYLDYAGERLIDSREDENSASSDLDKKIDDADALLAIIDGQKILSLMQNEPIGEIFELRELSSILQIIQQTQCPVHFIISKWDILQDKYEFEAIRKRLMENDDFKELVDRRTKPGKFSPLRLIPVSSVGIGFAEFRNGRMYKNRGAKVKPFQVEVPIACVLPDQLRIRLREITNQEIQLRREKNQIKETKPELEWFDIAGEWLGTGMRKLRNSLPRKYQFSEDLLELLIDYAEMGATQKRKKVKKEIEELREEKQKSLDRVHDEKTATEHAIYCFIKIVNLLDKDFPNSSLLS